jgi:hypothetical protein
MSQSVHAAVAEGAAERAGRMAGAGFSAGQQSFAVGSLRVWKFACFDRNKLSFNNALQQGLSLVLQLALGRIRKAQLWRRVTAKV